MGIVKPFGFMSGVTAEAPTAGPILTDLTLWLDSDNASSYPGTGTVWYDISPSGTTKDFTLVNSPTYTSGPGGYFTFNGSSQYASYNPGGGEYEWWDQVGNSDLTFELVINVDSFASDRSIMSQWGSVTAEQTYDWLITATNSNSIYVLTRDSANLPGLGGGMSAATWYHIFIEMEYTTGYTKSVYRNNTFINSSAWSNYTAWVPSAANTYIGRREAGLYFPGKIGMIRFYPRLLTPSEKTNNYNIENAKYNF